MPDADAWWSRAEPRLERTDLHARWFFGADDAAAADPLPRWTGYRLGTELVRRYCAAHGVGAGESVLVPADEFLDAW